MKIMSNHENQNSSLMVIRGVQGGRIFYVTALPNHYFADRLVSVLPAGENAQRPLVKSHMLEIEKYIESNRESFVLGAITLAIPVEGDFVPLQSLGAFQMGELKLPLDILFSSLDGQHRMQALINACAEDKLLLRQNTAC